MAYAQRLHLRLFLEGVEIPVISASVQSSKNQAAVATIQIPANDYAFNLRPRTLVHLFCYDIYNGSPSDEQLRVGGVGIHVQGHSYVDPELQGLIPPERFESTDDQTAVDLENSNYRLLFGGEVLGISYEKTPVSRGIVLQCVDWSSYWDIAFQYQVSGMSLGGGGIRAAFTGASTSVFNDFLKSDGDLIIEMMKSPPRSYPSLKNTLLGALVHILEAIGGTYYGARAIRGTNDFFSLAEMRLHLTQMIGANPFSNQDETRLLSANGFGGLFARSLGNLGKLVSIRQVLMALQKYIFHEVVPITTPRFIPAVQDPNVDQFTTADLNDDPRTRPLFQAATQMNTRARNIRERQEGISTPQEADRATRQRGGIEGEIRQLVRTCERAATRARVLEGQVGDATFQQVTAAFSLAGSCFSAVGRYTSQVHLGFPQADSPTGQAIVAQMNLAEKYFQSITNFKYRKRKPTSLRQPDPPPRLLTQIYRPDVWMVAPPRCNVIFPELYSSFSYGRNFTAEVSRLLLRTHSAFFGSDILFDGFYMSPSRILGQRTGREIGRGRTGIEPPDLADAPAWVVKDLMDHELYTGIIPAFERMSDLNLNALRGGSTLIEDVKVGYAQLAANHIFFQYRFKSRQLVCSGKFNPYIAFGFPALIIDKYQPLERLTNPDPDRAAQTLAGVLSEGEGDIEGVPEEERQRIREANNSRAQEFLDALGEPLPNTHFLGTPESLSHSLSATSGGQTNMQMGYARTTDEKTEFLGDNTGFRSRARRVRNGTTNTDVASLEVPAVGARGPRGGEIINVTNVTEQYSRRQTRRTTNRTATGQTRFIGGTRLPLYVPERNYVGRRRRATQVLVGVSQPASSYGTEVLALVGTGGLYQSSVADGVETLVEFRAFRIQERVGVYRRELVDLPAEEITFPPWYGDQYRSSQIGSLYSYFFGVGAITDNTVFVAPNSIASVIAQVQNDDAEASAAADPTNVRAQTIQLANRIRTRITDLFRPAEQDQVVLDPDPTDAESNGAPGDDSQQQDVRGEVAARSPMVAAINEITKTYSLARLNGYNVNEFIKAYTWRPIASAVDILGTANLEINDRGEVVRGTEGFHSRAYGDYDDLRTLVDQGDGRPVRILGLTTADPDETRGQEQRRAERDEKISQRLDTRKEKRVHVLRYLHSLMSQRGVVG